MKICRWVVLCLMHLSWAGSGGSYFCNKVSFWNLSRVYRLSSILCSNVRARGLLSGLSPNDCSSESRVTSHLAWEHLHLSSLHKSVWIIRALIWSIDFFLVSVLNIKYIFRLGCFNPSLFGRLLRHLFT